MLNARLTSGLSTASPTKGVRSTPLSSWPTSSPKMARSPSPRPSRSRARRRTGPLPKAGSSRVRSSVRCSGPRMPVKAPPLSRRSASRSGRAADGHSRQEGQSERTHMLDLNGTSSVVTGGASGIGEAAARQLAARGAKVVVADLNGERGKQIADELGGVYVHCDVTETETIVGAVDAAVELGPLRTCVTAAGIGWPARTIGKDGEYASAHDLDIYKKVLAINLVGTFDTIRLAATKMSQTEPV